MSDTEEGSSGRDWMIERGNLRIERGRGLSKAKPKKERRRCEGRGGRGCRREILGGRYWEEDTGSKVLEVGKGGDLR